MPQRTMKHWLKAGASDLIASHVDEVSSIGIADMQCGLDCGGYGEADGWEGWRVHCVVSFWN